MNPLELRRFIQGSEKKILFCGDDDLDMAANYLGSIINEEGYDMDYVPSPLPFPNNISPEDYDLIILSDYPREQIPDDILQDIADYVRNGGSLLMIGGWESFTGLNIEYKDSPIEDILPVMISVKDDRRNYDQGIAVLPCEKMHPVTNDLAWDRPAVIGGYNEFIPKEDAQLVLCGQKLILSFENDTPKAQINHDKIPLLVYGKMGMGKSAALAFDLAPHWVGGFVDWGQERKHVEFGDGFIEVGDQYYRFVGNLLKSMM